MNFQPPNQICHVIGPATEDLIIWEQTLACGASTFPQSKTDGEKSRSVSDNVLQNI